MLDADYWINTKELRRVSLPARAVWIDMVAAMITSPKRGYLPLSEQQLAQLCGIDASALRFVVQELHEAGLFEIRQGVAYSPRVALCNTISSNGKPRLDDRAVALQREPTEALLNWINWWNALRQRALVAHGVDAKHPSLAVCKAWLRAHEHKDLAELLQQRRLITDRIIAADFGNAGWFRLEVLLAGKNKSGEWHVRKLLDGGFAARQRALAMDAADPNVLTTGQAWEQARRAVEWRGRLAHDPAKVAEMLAQMNPIARHVCESLGWKEMAEGQQTSVRAHFIRLYAEAVARHEQEQIKRATLPVQPTQLRLLTDEGQERTA